MSKKLQVNDILAASDIDYIDTLENENAKLRRRNGALEDAYKTINRAYEECRRSTMLEF